MVAIGINTFNGKSWRPAQLLTVKAKKQITLERVIKRGGRVKTECLTEAAAPRMNTTTRTCIIKTAHPIQW